MNNFRLASIDDGKNCYPSTKMAYGAYAVKLMQEEYKKTGIRSGYEEFFKLIPTRLFDMMEFILNEASARDGEIALAVGKIRDNPRAYIEKTEREVSFRKTELELFKRGEQKYTYAEFDVDVPYGRNGLCSHYLGRNLYPYLCIQEAIEKGAKQVIIPACGLDTTAELLATEFPEVQFYISDLSNVVDERRDLMGKEFAEKFFEGRYLENIHLMPVDLSNPCGLVDTLKNELTFDPKQRTVYAFTGITMYLKPDVVKETIENIANATPDSDIFMGIISHYTKGEAKLTKNVYKNNAILPLHKIYEMAEEISPNVPNGMVVRGMSAANFQRYVDWDQVTQNYLQDHPEINLDAVDINEARTMSQICQGTYHFMSEARKAETWKVYDAYVRASSYQEYMEIEKATEDKKRSYQSINMIKAMVAVYNLHKQCEEQGILSGYEELFKALPPKMVDMALFILEEVADAAKLKNASKELVKTGKEIRRIKNNPRKYIEGIEKKSSFRQGELECFQTNNLDGYMYEMFRKDISFGRNCLTSHYYGRSAYLDLCIREAIGKGSRQIVVPACGLDTTSERLVSEYPNVQFYLSDLPSIVEERSELIKNEKFSKRFFADGRYPENIHWASVDLSNANGLTELLRNEASFDSEQRTTYVFSGITMYLKPETVQKTIANLARMTPLFDMFIGIASRSTCGEAKMVRGTYKGNAFLPLYQVQEMVGEIGEGLIVRGMSGANLQRYVDDEQITKNYLKSNPKLKLDPRDINRAREAYRISEEGFYHIRPQQIVSEEWAVYKDYIENPDHASLINKTNDQINRRENPLKQNILAGSSLVV